MAGLVKLEHILSWFVSVGMMSCLSRRFVLTFLPRGCMGRRKIAITAQDHSAEPFSCPAHILLAVLGDSESAEFLCGKVQFLPVVCYPVLNRLTTTYNRSCLPGWWLRPGSSF